MFVNGIYVFGGIEQLWDQRQASWTRKSRKNRHAHTRTHTNENGDDNTKTNKRITENINCNKTMAFFLYHRVKSSVCVCQQEIGREERWDREQRKYVKWNLELCYCSIFIFSLSTLFSVSSFSILFLSVDAFSKRGENKKILLEIHRIRFPSTWKWLTYADIWRYYSTHTYKFTHTTLTQFTYFLFLFGLCHWFTNNCPTTNIKNLYKVVGPTHACTRYVHTLVSFI